MSKRRAAPVSDRRKVDAEFRLHLIHRSDALEQLVTGIATRVDRLEESLTANTKLIQECVTALKTLSEETSVTRQLETNGKGTANLIRMLAKPLAWVLVVLLGAVAFVSFLKNGVWPGWYTDIKELM